MKRGLVDWLGGHGAIVIVAVLIVVGGTWGFVELADAVRGGGTQRFDEWAMRAMRRPDNPDLPIGPRGLAEAGRDITGLGGVVVLGLVTAAVVGYLLIERKRRAAAFVVFATLGGLLLSSLLKGHFERERPSGIAQLSYVYTSSFPSGHAMMSAIVYLTLGSLLMRFEPRRRLKLYYLLVAMLITGLVGVSRVFMGVHYPTDVLAGWTAGLVWALACWLAARAMQHRGQVEEADETTSEL